MRRCSRSSAPAPCPPSASRRGSGRAPPRHRTRASPPPHRGTPRAPTPRSRTSFGSKETLARALELYELAVEQAPIADKHVVAALIVDGRDPRGARRHATWRSSSSSRRSPHAPALLPDSSWDTCPNENASGRDLRARHGVARLPRVRRGPGADGDGSGQAIASLREPRTTMGGVNLVVGFRPELWARGRARRMRRRRHRLRPRHRRRRRLHDAGDAARRGALAVGQRLRRRLRERAQGDRGARPRVATVAEETSSWPYQHDRDLTGFIDGTENPTPDRRARARADPGRPSPAVRARSCCCRSGSTTRRRGRRSR